LHQKNQQTSHLASMPDWFKIKFLHSRTQDSGCKMANFTQIVEPVIQHFNPIFANPVSGLKVDTKYEEY
jgi:hypothetical protein